jgi:hypothetical protein
MEVQLNFAELPGCEGKIYVAQKGCSECGTILRHLCGHATGRTAIAARRRCPGIGLRQKPAQFIFLSAATSAPEPVWHVYLTQPPARPCAWSCMINGSRDEPVTFKEDCS